MNGTPERDLLVGTDGPDTIDGAAGDDTIQGLDGASFLTGGDGNDSIVGGADFDRINGNKGDDTIDGGAGGGDWLSGGQGDDLIVAHAGDALLFGNMGNDTILGGLNRDTVRGGQGDDVLYGGAGDDWLSGDRGSDTLTGGPGADIFYSFSGAGLDLVTDFNKAEGDRIQLDTSTPYTVRQYRGDTIIDMGGGDRLVLRGLDLKSIAPNRVEIVAHRGLAGGRGEETLESYEAAYKLGLRTMELDLQVTKDGKVILMHDGTVDRTTNGSGAVKDLTLAQIKSFGIKGVPGATVPTWEEFLDWAKAHPDVHFWAETKEYRTQADIQLMLTPLVDSGLASRTTWDSFRFEDLKWLRDHGATSEASLVIQALPGNVAQELSRDASLGGSITLMVQDSVLLSHPEFIVEARNAGIDIAAWTVNDKAQVDRLLALGVHIITSDKLIYTVNDDGWITVQ